MFSIFGFTKVNNSYGEPGDGENTMRWQKECCRSQTCKNEKNIIPW